MSAAVVFIWHKRPELGGEAAELILRPNGAWLLSRGGESLPLHLHGQSTVSQRVLLLCFRAEGEIGRFDVVLWRAEQPPQHYRRLQVYLKLYASEAE